MLDIAEIRDRFGRQRTHARRSAEMEVARGQRHAQTINNLAKSRETDATGYKTTANGASERQERSEASPFDDA